MRRSWAEALRATSLFHGNFALAFVLVSLGVGLVLLVPWRAAVAVLAGRSGRALPSFRRSTVDDSRRYPCSITYEKHSSNRPNSYTSLTGHLRETLM